MAESQALAGDTLQLARSLVGHLESGDEQWAVSVIAELAGVRDSLLFREVGRLTHELHDWLDGLVVDSQLADIAHNEMPSAAERLRYVIGTTQQTANNTLGAVEDSLPLADSSCGG